MRFNCGPTWEEKHEAKKIWHKHFVWWPTRIASNDCRWLETIERKGRYFDNYAGSKWRWEYRLPEGDT